MSLISILSGVFITITVFYTIIVYLCRNTHLNGRYELGEIVNNKFIFYKDYEKNWISEWKGNKGIDGYKLRECSGVYVILVFNHYVRWGNFSKYRDVYVGQSLYMYSRVHDHLNGNGNGDVYADVKYGKRVYVKCIPCNKKDMNKLEKKLIEKYDATSSYNVTKGGSTIRGD